MIECSFASSGGASTPQNVGSCPSLQESQVGWCAEANTARNVPVSMTLMSHATATAVAANEGGELSLIRLYNKFRMHAANLRPRLEFIRPCERAEAHHVWFGLVLIGTGRPVPRYPNSVLARCFAEALSFKYASIALYTGMRDTEQKRLRHSWCHCRR